MLEVVLIDMLVSIKVLKFRFSGEF